MNIRIYFEEALVNLIEFKKPYKWRKGFFDFTGDINFPSAEEIKADQKDQCKDLF